MQKNSTANTRNGVLLSLLILGVIAALVILPYQFRSEAGSKGKGNSLNPRTESHEEGLENYDIREVKSDETADSLMKFRQSVGKDASAVVTTREDFVRGENELRTKVPTLKIEYNNDIRIPEVITPDVWKNEPSYLTGPSNLKRAEILRSFVKENNSLIGVDDAQAEGLKVTADYTNPDGNLSFAHLEQRINNIPVFRGEVKAGFTKDGKMIRVINNLAPGLDYESLSTDFRNPLDAVKSAARSINYELKSVDVTPNAAASNDLKTVFGNGDWATTAEKMYFPTEPGVAVPSWRVLIWQPVNAYYIIVDAETGTMLWRKNVTEDQTQSATYQVYTNPNAMIDVADSPAPLSPSPADPTVGTQAPVIARTTRTLIGNEAPYTFNNNGWITDGANVTDGNALEAGIDRDGTNGVDLPLQTGTPNRVFNSTWNPAPGNPAPGDDPLTAQAQRGAVIQMFYVMNRYHDEMYRLGFTEQAFNFQGDNFGRGGVGGDRISGEGQDSSGTNNANFATVADGGRGRMQMFVWTGPTPDYDGTGDAEVIIHEVTHGTSNRLHGNASGLSTNMARGMGEGWSDFYAHAMLSEPTDPANGIYALGGYATYLISAGFTGNYYYGIRRYPKAPIGFLGPNGKPHNAYTFSYINADCNTRLGTANFAFARGPIGVTQCDQVHNIGEIWSSALWEVRTLMVSRLGWSVGNRKALQLVTDGMKLAPIGPTLLQERDAIIAAAQASAVSPEAAADVVDVREGFRRRGMGFSASVTVQSPAAVVEAFDFPNVQTVNPFSVSDSTGDNDGFPEPGESILLSVAVTNSTGATVTNVTANVTGGGSANYGDIANGVTVTRQIPYTVPTGAICGSLHQVTVNVSSSVGAQSPVVREFRLGAPVGGAPVTFTNNTALTIPDSGVSAPYGTTIAVSGLSGSKLITLEITGNTHTFPGDLDYLLVGPGGQKFSLLSDSGSTGDTTNLTFTLSDSATAQPSTTQWAAGNFKPVNIGAGDPFAAPAPAAPYLEAPAAGSASFASVFGTDGAAMNGTWTLYVVDDAAGDFGSQAGWKLTFGGNDYTCTLAPTVKSRADFDGDGKTDLSVFRPSNNTWYLQKSTDGFSAATFGATGDTATPRDWDGDGKADVAVHRPVATDGVADFFILKSSDNTLMTHVWGTTNDVNVSADYDGDGKSDPAIFRPSTNTWWVFQTSNTTGVPTTFGASGDVPVTGDFDGDGKADLTVFRNGQWITRKSSDNSVSFTSFGLATDKLVPADYDGDNKDDIAVWRPSNGVWYILRSTNGAVDFIQFGANGDVAVPGDYDGDGKDDQAVYRGGTWFLNRSTAGFSASPFGLATDVPAPSKYIP